MAGPKHHIRLLPTRKPKRHYLRPLSPHIERCSPRLPKSPRFLFGTIGSVIASTSFSASNSSSTRLSTFASTAYSNRFSSKPISPNEIKSNHQPASPSPILLCGVIFPHPLLLLFGIAPHLDHRHGCPSSAFRGLKALISRDDGVLALPPWKR